MMRKKPAGRRTVTSKPKPHARALNADKDHAKDLFFHARSFHLAAKKLAGALEFGSSRFAEFDVSPVIFLYRHALELHLKTLILGGGGNFLAEKPDLISISQSHSVSWLAQFVRQILTALGWENEFKCDGIENFDDFKSLVGQLNSADPGLYVFRSPVDPRSEVAVREFVKRMDRLLDLLESTADALAAEWNLRRDGVDFDDGGFGDNGTTRIQ